MARKRVVLLDVMKHFEYIGIKSNPFFDKQLKNPFDGKCVYLNNAFGIYLQKYKHELLYESTTTTGNNLLTLTGIQSIAGQFKKSSIEYVEHTWIKLLFGKKSIQLDFTAKQFEISGNVTNNLECYVFINDERYNTNDAEIKEISERWKDLQELSFIFENVNHTQISKTILTKMRYFNVVHKLILDLLVLLNTNDE